MNSSYQQGGHGIQQFLSNIVLRAMTQTSAAQIRIWCCRFTWPHVEREQRSRVIALLVGRRRRSRKQLSLDTTIPVRPRFSKVFQAIQGSNEQLVLIANPPSIGDIFDSVEN
jgi:hypothetical protein